MSDLKKKIYQCGAFNSCGFTYLNGLSLNWNTASKLFAVFDSFTHLLSLLAASDVGLNSRAD